MGVTATFNRIAFERKSISTEHTRSVGFRMRQKQQITHWIRSPVRVNMNWVDDECKWRLNYISFCNSDLFEAIRWWSTFVYFVVCTRADQLAVGNVNSSWKLYEIDPNGMRKCSAQAADDFITADEEEKERERKGRNVCQTKIKTETQFALLVLNIVIKLVCDGMADLVFATASPLVKWLAMQWRYPLSNARHRKSTNAIKTYR